MRVSSVPYLTPNETQLIRSAVSVASKDQLPLGWLNAVPQAVVRDGLRRN